MSQELICGICLTAWSITIVFLVHVMLCRRYWVTAKELNSQEKDDPNNDMGL